MSIFDCQYSLRGVVERFSPLFGNCVMSSSFIEVSTGVVGA
jgi:hypothetical protein